MNNFNYTFFKPGENLDRTILYGDEQLRYIPERVPDYLIGVQDSREFISLIIDKLPTKFWETLEKCFLKWINYPDNYPAMQEFVAIVIRVVDFLYSCTQTTDIILQRDLLCHKSTCLVKVMDTFLTLFLTASHWYDNTNNLRLLRDILLLGLKCQEAYIRGTLPQVLKSYFNQTSNMIIHGSFLKAHKRLRSHDHTLNGVIRSRYYLYSVEMAKKGLEISSLFDAVKNVTKSLTELVSPPKEYTHSDIDESHVWLCIKAGIRCVFDETKPKFDIEKISSRAPSTKASYEARSGQGIRVLDKGLPRNTSLNPDINGKTGTATQVSSIILNNHLARLNAASPDEYNEAFDAGTTMSQAAFDAMTQIKMSDAVDLFEARQEAYYDLQSNWRYSLTGENTTLFYPDPGSIPVDIDGYPLIPGCELVRPTILNEAGFKLRPLTIQSYIFQNGPRYIQSVLLKSWFNSSFSTHEDLNGGSVRKVFDGPGALKLSVDYDNATNYVTIDASLRCLNLILDEFRIEGEERCFLNNVLSARTFEFVSVGYNHPLLDLDDDDENYYTRSEKKFLQKCVSDSLVRENGPRAIQLSGQMMGNPLSFPLLCHLNLGVIIASVLEDRGLRIIHMDDDGVVLIRRTDTPERFNVFFGRERITLNWNDFRQFLDHIIINGDDGTFSGSHDMKEIHNRLSTVVGFRQNKTKSKESETNININSKSFEKFEGDIIDVGYLNLSLLYNRNVKNTNQILSKDNVSDVYLDLLGSEHLFPDRIHNLFLSKNQKLFDSLAKKTYRIENTVEEVLAGSKPVSYYTEYNVGTLFLPKHLGGHNFQETCLGNFGLELQPVWTNSELISRLYTFAKKFSARKIIVEKEGEKQRPDIKSSQVLSYITKLMLHWLSEKGVIEISIGIPLGWGDPIDNLFDSILSQFSDLFALHDLSSFCHRDKLEHFLSPDVVDQPRLIDQTQLLDSAYLSQWTLGYRVLDEAKFSEYFETFEGLLKFTPALREVRNPIPNIQNDQD